MKHRGILKTLALFMVTTTLLKILTGCSRNDEYDPIAPDLENGNYSVNENNVRFLGRYYENENTGAVQFSWSNAGFTF